jgi:hypothetical protein
MSAQQTGERAAVPGRLAIPVAGKKTWLLATGGVGLFTVLF